MAKRSLFILPIVLSGLAPIASCKAAESKPTQPQNVNQTAAVKSPIVEPSIAAAQPPVVTKPLSPEQTVKVNALVKRLMTCNENNFDAISDELDKLGESAIPFIVPLLKNPSEAVRTCGVVHLMTMKKSSKLVIQSIVPLLKDPTAEVRVVVLWALSTWSIVPSFSESDIVSLKTAIPSLIPLLKDGDADVRASTAQVLGGIGQSANSAIPSLIPRLKDPNAKVRQYAAQALGRMGESAKSAIPSLISLLKDENADVRQYVAEALGNMGESAKPAIPSIVQLFEHDRDPMVRWSAVKALESLGHRKPIYERAHPADVGVPL
jgi:HEAT repeat protein